MKKYSQILGDVYGKPWAILPSKLDSICLALESRIAGVASMSDAELENMAAANAAPAHKPGQSIAVLPLWGTLHHHGSMLSKASGGTSMSVFGQQFTAAMEDSSIGTVLIHAHGPGGTVMGTPELSDLIFQYRGQKKIITHIDGMAASATYWACTSADEVFITPSGDCGSIGVVRAHRDISGAEEKAGEKTTLIATPERKVSGNPYEALTDEYLAEVKADHQAIYSQFTETIARNRGKTVGTVKETFGGGGMVNAKAAAALGMVDGIKTFSQVIDSIVASVSERQGHQSAGHRRRALALAHAQSI